MKRIVLIRHAKSSWADESLEDVDRPLNDRGQNAAPTMGAWLKKHGIAPDHVWLSPAKRCKETWGLMADELKGKAPSSEHKALYLADPKTTLDVLRLTPSNASTVFLVGHQPGVGSTTRKLADGKESSTLSRAYRKFPTAALAILEADVKKWEKLEFKGAKFTHFVAPKELS